MQPVDQSATMEIVPPVADSWDSPYGAHARTYVDLAAGGYHLPASLDAGGCLLRGAGGRSKEEDGTARRQR
jgi:hypothetical protein